MLSEESLDQFKRATAATIKAMGHRPELEVAFMREGVETGETRVRLPEATEERAQATLRGAADTAAVRLRHHQASLAAQPRTSSAAAQAYEALEQARCEALGAQKMLGARRNISAFLESECRRQAYDKAQTPKDVPIAEALHLRAYATLTGATLGAASLTAVSVWQTVLDERLEPFWPRLRKTLNDQATFAAIAQEMLAALALAPRPSDKPKASEPEQPKPQEEASEDATKEDQPASASCGSGEEAAAAQDQTSGESGPEESAQEDQTSEEGEGETEPRFHSGPVTTYRVFTTAFDEVVRAEELCPPEELQRLRRLLDHQLKPYQGAVVRLANKLQRLLMAQQVRSWDFDVEEGVLDPARLSRIVTNPLEPLMFKIEKETSFRDTVVSLLIDNSGSMRGRPITLAAISTDILARTLERCGVKTEILGFTTRTWKGGRARELWIAKDKPPLPGRLNEVRHVIYKRADTPWRRARQAIGLMLREGLLKENIDGEALMWAHQRLLARPEERRILMVISDGAPVDDSTQSVNPTSYLDTHLRSVIAWIERDSPVELMAIGIGHDVTRYYRRAVTIADAQELGDTMTRELAALFGA